MPLGGFLCWVRYPFVRRLCLITKETEHRSYFNTVIYHSRYFWRPTNNNKRTLFFITCLCHITAKLHSIKLLLQLTMLYTFQCPLPSLQQWQHLWKDDLKPSFKCHSFLLFYQYYLEKTVTFSSSGTFNLAFKSPKIKNLIPKENTKNIFFTRFFETIERCRKRPSLN